MSRTDHHRNQRRQHVGEDLWSRRIGGGNGCMPRTTYFKWLTRKIERAEKLMIEHKAKEDHGEV